MEQENGMGEVCDKLSEWEVDAKREAFRDAQYV